MSQVFLSYARSDDEPFVKQLYEDLTKNGIKGWWDRKTMESRGRTFLQELRDAIDASDRLIAVVGPKAVTSDYVKVEWEHALLFAKGVIPILRMGDYNLVPPELSKLHCPNFLKERQYDEALEELLRLLAEPLPKLGPFLTSISSLPPNYLPRKECINQLKQTIMADIERPVVIASTKQITALQGMGGAGKSVLAAVFARTTETRKAFYDGIFWVTVGLDAKESDLIGYMKRIGTKFGDDAANYSSKEEAKDSLQKVLSDKVCLIILDDIWEVPQAEPFRDALGPRCRLLITTRNEDVVTSHGAHEHKIKALSESEALNLLANWCEKDSNSLPSEAKGVAKECGYLPLALSMCGAMASKSGTAWSDILEALQEADLGYIEAHLPNYKNSNVMKAFKVSIDFLSSEDPDAVQRYQELAILPADESVPEAALATLWAHTGNLKKRISGKLLTKLKDRALLQLDGEAPNRLISLHDLQLDYLRATTDDLPCLHNQLLEAYSKECGNKWSAGPTDGYFFEHLAYHLVGAGRKVELRELLLDFNWIQSKLNATDTHLLISDYDFFHGDYPVEMVKGAIELSANALSKDKKLLAGQLLGRLELSAENEIKLLLGYIRKHRSGIRILPLTGSLTPAGGSLMRTLEGHSSQVDAVSITPDGNYAVSASSDMTLKVWDLKEGKEVHTLTGHSDWISAVSVTPDGNYAVSASDDKTLKVWDLKTGKEVHTLTGHSSSVIAVSITPDGNYAVSASEDKTLKVWDLKTGKKVHTLKGHSDSVVAVFVTSDGNYAISASWDTMLKVWNLKTGKKVHTLTGYSSPVEAVSVTPDGNYAISASDDKTLKVWDLKTGKEVHTLKGHTQWVTAVSITPDGNYAVSASVDMTFKVWDLKTGKEVRTLKGHSNSVYVVSISPDGNYAVSASFDNTLNVWDLLTGKEIAAFNGKSPFYCAVFSRDGTIIVTGEESGTMHFLLFEREVSTRNKALILGSQ